MPTASTSVRSSGGRPPTRASRVSAIVSGNAERAPAAPAAPIRGSGRPWLTRAVRRPGERLGRPRGEQLLDEERVPLGSPPDRLERGRSDPVASDRPDLPVDVRLGQPLEVDAFGQRHAGQLCEPRGDRIRGREAVGADGEHEQPSLAQHVAEQEGEQVAGGAVGPLDVLDPDRERARGRQPRDQRERGLEQPRAGGRPLSRSRGPRGRHRRTRTGPAARARPEWRERLAYRRVVGGHQPAGDFRDRHERDRRVAQVDARAREGEAAVALDLAEQLAQQARCRSGLAGQDRQARLPSPTSRHACRSRANSATRSSRCGLDTLTTSGW
jgi:hypothetical protein